MIPEFRLACRAALPWMLLAAGSAPSLWAQAPAPPAGPPQPLEQPAEGDEPPIFIERYDRPYRPNPNRPRLIGDNPYRDPQRLISGFRELQALRREWDELSRNRDDLLNRLQRARGSYENDDYSDNTILNRPVVDRLLARMHEQVGRENDLIEKAGRLVLMIGMASPSWENAIRDTESTGLKIPEPQRKLWLDALEALNGNDRLRFTQLLLGNRLGSAVSTRMSGQLWYDIEEDRTPMPPPNSPEIRKRWQERLRNLERRNRILQQQLEAQGEEIQLLYSLLSDEPIGQDDEVMADNQADDDPTSPTAAP